MADRFILPRVRAADPITVPDGRAANAFVRFWDTMCRLIESQENRQNTLIADLQAVQQQQAAQLELINDALELAGLALATADAASGGTARSGSDTGSFALTGTGDVSPCTVPLLTVSAGLLTIPGTGPGVLYGTTTMTGGLTVEAEYDIVEVTGTETVVFSGTFTINDVTGDEPSQVFQVVHPSAPDVAAFSETRASTGSVSYRVDVRRVSGATMTGVRFYLFARRA